jgi:hypothetical protein
MEVDGLIICITSFRIQFLVLLILLPFYFKAMAELFIHSC